MLKWSYFHSYFGQILELTSVSDNDINNTFFYRTSSYEAHKIYYYENINNIIFILKAVIDS